MRPCRCRTWGDMIMAVYGGGYRLAMHPYDAGTIYCACNVGRSVGSVLDPAARPYAVGVVAGKKQVAIFEIACHDPWRWWREIEHRDGHRLRYMFMDADNESLVLGFHFIWGALLWGGLRFAGAGAPGHDDQK